MFHKPFLSFSLICSLLLLVGAVAFADTIRLKDGTVIRGDVTGFRDQQFTVLIGSGERGRRSQVTVYIEDVESIEFDRPTNTNAAISNPGGNTNNDNQSPARPDTDVGNVSRPGENNTGNSSTGNNRNDTGRANNNAAPNNSAANSSGDRNTTSGGGTGTFFPTNVQVRADNTANGWADTGLLVTRGQRIRISATGRVSLGGGKFSTPSGLLAVTDRDKLMRDRPTGSLIAVIGDDNDEFIYIGGQREFTAQRDGRLFLGVNEGNLNDNSGNYDVVIEAEAVSRGGNR